MTDKGLTATTTPVNGEASCGDIIYIDSPALNGLPALKGFFVVDSAYWLETDDTPVKDYVIRSLTDGRCYESDLVGDGSYFAVDC